MGRRARVGAHEGPAKGKRGVISQRYSARLKRKVWGFDIRRGGRRYRAFIYDTRKQAEDAVLAIRQRSRKAELGISTDPLTSPKLAALITARLATIEKKSERTRSTRVLQTLAAVVAADALVTEITTADLRRFVARRQNENQSASSIDRELNIIAATLHAAGSFFPQLEQWIAPKMPRPKVAKRGRERLITVDEIDALLGQLYRPQELAEQHQAYEARVRVGQIFEWALLTGMRHGEIDRLKWSDIDRQGEQVRVESTKTDSIRYLAISPRMVEILEERRKQGGQFVFTRGGNTNPKFYRILRDACLACGIEYGRKSGQGLTLHDARHSFVTRLLQAGVDLSTIQSLSGHSSRVLALWYGHATAESRVRAMLVAESSIFESIWGPPPAANAAQSASAARGSSRKVNKLCKVK